VTEILCGDLLHLTLEYDNFSKNISQGNVATNLRYSGILNNRFTTN